MTFLQKVTKEQVIEAYKTHKSYLSAGKALGITRQRVEQIIKPIRDPEIMIIRIGNKKHKHGPTCLMCTRVFDKKRVKHASKGYCRACFPFALQNKVPTKLRPAMYPKSCKSCKTLLDGKRRALGYCITCYNREVTAKKPGRQEKLKEYSLKQRSKRKDKSILSSIVELLVSGT